MKHVHKFSAFLLLICCLIHFISNQFDKNSGCASLIDVDTNLNLAQSLFLSNQQHDS